MNKIAFLKFLITFITLLIFLTLGGIVYGLVNYKTTPKLLSGKKKAAPAEATQHVQPLSVEEAADICGVTVPATQEIQDPPKPSKKAASAAVAAETAAITSAIENMIAGGNA